MESYRVLIFQSAKGDMRNIVDLINERSPQAALSLYDELVENINSLTQLPHRCPLVKDRVLRRKGYRVLVVHSYLVFYVVSEWTVEIRRILHGRQKYAFLL